MPREIQLWVPFYLDKNPQRRAEILLAMERNLANPLIVKVWLVSEEPTGVDHPKAESLLLERRPTFGDVFAEISKRTADDDLNVVSNCDIWFDDSIGRLWELASPDVFFALARDDKARRNANYSQDVWAFLGKPREMKADFLFGIPGCDNAIAYVAKSVGYDVVNIGRSVWCYHIHNSLVRNYTAKQRLTLPYHFIHVLTIEKLLERRSRKQRPPPKWRNRR